MAHLWSRGSTGLISWMVPGSTSVSKRPGEVLDDTHNCGTLVDSWEDCSAGTLGGLGLSIHVVSGPLSLLFHVAFFT